MKRIKHLMMLAIVMLLLLTSCGVNKKEISQLYITVWEEGSTRFFAVNEKELPVNELKKNKQELTKEKISDLLKEYENLVEAVVRSDSSIAPHRAMRELDQFMYKAVDVNLIGKRSREWQNDELEVIVIDHEGGSITLAEILDSGIDEVSVRISSEKFNKYMKEEPYIYLYYEGLEEFIVSKQQELIAYEQQKIQSDIDAYLAKFDYEKTTIKIWTKEKTYNRTPVFAHEFTLLKEMFQSAKHHDVDKIGTDGTTKHTFTDGTHRIIIYSMGPYGNVAEIPELGLFVHFDNYEYLQSLEAFLFYYDFTKPANENQKWKTATSIKNYFDNSYPVIIEPLLYQMNVGAPFTEYDPHIYYDFETNEYRTRFFLKDTFALETVVYRWDTGIASFKDCRYDDASKHYSDACTAVDKAVIDKHMCGFLADSQYKLDRKIFMNEIEAFKKKQ